MHRRIKLLELSNDGRKHPLPRGYPSGPTQSCVVSLMMAVIMWLVSPVNRWASVVVKPLDELVSAQSRPECTQTLRYNKTGILDWSFALVVDLSRTRKPEIRDIVDRLLQTESSEVTLVDVSNNEAFNCLENSDPRLTAIQAPALAYCPAIAWRLAFGATSGRFILFHLSNIGYQLPPRKFALATSSTVTYASDGVDWCVERSVARDLILGHPFAISQFGIHCELLHCFDNEGTDNLHVEHHSTRGWGMWRMKQARDKVLLALLTMSMGQQKQKTA